MAKAFRILNSQEVIFGVGQYIDDPIDAERIVTRMNRTIAFQAVLGWRSTKPILGEILAIPDNSRGLIVIPAVVVTRQETIGYDAGHAGTNPGNRLIGILVGTYVRQIAKCQNIEGLPGIRLHELHKFVPSDVVTVNPVQRSLAIIVKSSIGT